MATQDTVDAVRRAAFLLRGITELADYLEKVGSIEQSASEASGRLTVVGQELAAKQAELAVAKDGLSAVRAEADQILATAGQNAEKIKAQAEADAQGVKDEANAVATDTLKEAKAKAESVVRDAQARAQTSIDAADAVEARKAALDKASVEKAAELADLNSKITEAREQIARLLGR